MNLPTSVLLLAMALGVILILRAAAIVATKGDGRFRGDPLVTIVLGFGLVLLAQYLLQR
jgi:hypothetical protein